MYTRAMQNLASGISTPPSATLSATRLSSRMDAEEVHALLERFFDIVDAVVDRYGGVIDKHMGDAAMALFGAPRAHGDDALRAIRAALEIQASIPTPHDAQPANHASVSDPYRH